MILSFFFKFYQCDLSGNAVAFSISFFFPFKYGLDSACCCHVSQNKWPRLAIEEILVYFELCTKTHYFQRLCFASQPCIQPYLPTRACQNLAAGSAQNHTVSQKAP